jgi:hypothetical protein
MAQYQFTYTGNIIKKLINGVVVAWIPMAPGNTDYQTYLAWIAQGNTPLPADPPPPPSILAGVDFDTNAVSDDQVSAGLANLRAFLNLASPTNADAIAALKTLIRAFLFVCHKLRWSLIA